MPMPEFTPDEQYLINVVKSPKASSLWGAYMWGYVIGGLALGAFAAYRQEISLMVAAFVVVCGFRIYEEWYQAKWIPLWRSIIEKYEVAADDRDE